MHRLTLIAVFVLSLFVGWFGANNHARAQAPCAAVTDTGDSATDLNGVQVFSPGASLSCITSVTTAIDVGTKLGAGDVVFLFNTAGALGNKGASIFVSPEFEKISISVIINGKNQTVPPSGNMLFTTGSTLVTTGKSFSITVQFTLVAAPFTVFTQHLPRLQTAIH